MGKRIGLLLLVLLVGWTSVVAQPPADAFRSMLWDLGVDEENLGFHPKGYWTRYPDPQDIPFKNLAFDDLFAEPQRIYDFVRVMALAGEDYLHPEYLTANSNGLLKTSYYLGIRPATAQTRDYSASLWAELDEEEPLLDAVRQTYRVAGREFTFNAMGSASDFPLIERDLREATASLHPDLRRVVGRTVVHLADAWRWRQVGMRNVDMGKALACWRIRQLGETQFDGLEYFPQLEDCANDIDMPSIYYAGMILLETSEQLADSLAILRERKDIDWSRQRLDIMTPLGRILIGGIGRDVHIYNDLLLLIDPDGNDVYQGAVGATPSLDIPISLAVDLAGDDEYLCEDEYLPSQGSAVFGAAMLLDVKGNDHYSARRLGQGAAMLGIGILADLHGDDEYELGYSGQGGAYFGVGLALDNTGDDRYRLYGDGQGYGGVGGVGTLLNRTGDDEYWCAPDLARAFRPDYHHSADSANYSYAQGCGIGRRGDITDGHSWAGGMGSLIDLDGDDVYISRNWSAGCGYWYGMGFLYDRAGDDEYRSENWSQVAGAHFCIAAHIDEAGDDKHLVMGDYADGLSFGHDYTVGLLLDREGNDTYRNVGDGLCFGINMSQMLFFELAGDDTYITAGTSRNYGANNFKRYDPPPIGAFHHLFSDQICLFGDLAGTDRYLAENDEGEQSADPRMSDGGTLFIPTAEERNALSNPRHYGLARDFDDATTPPIPFFEDKMKTRYEEFK